MHHGPERWESAGGAYHRAGRCYWPAAAAGRGGRNLAPDLLRSPAPKFSPLLCRTARVTNRNLGPEYSPGLARISTNRFENVARCGGGCEFRAHDIVLDPWRVGGRSTPQTRHRADHPVLFHGARIHAGGSGLERARAAMAYPGGG